MSIFQIIAEEAAKRFGQDEKGYEMYKAGVKHYKDAAKEGYRVLWFQYISYYSLSDLGKFL